MQHKVEILIHCANSETPKDERSVAVYDTAVEAWRTGHFINGEWFCEDGIKFWNNQISNWFDFPKMEEPEEIKFFDENEFIG